MTKLKAFFFAMIVWPIFPIRWWEGKPFFAMFLMLITVWFIGAGKTISSLFYIGAFVIVMFEFITIPKRVDLENKRMARFPND